MLTHIDPSGWEHTAAIPLGKSHWDYFCTVLATLPTLHFSFFRGALSSTNVEDFT